LLTCTRCAGAAAAAARSDGSREARARRGRARGREPEHRASPLCVCARALLAPACLRAPHTGPRAAMCRAVPAAAEVPKPGARGRGATTRCLAPSRSFSPGAARPTATRPGVLSCNWLLANCDRALAAAGLDRSLYRPQLDFSWITLCRARGCIVLLARVPTLHADEGQAGRSRSRELRRQRRLLLSYVGRPRRVALSADATRTYHRTSYQLVSAPGLLHVRPIL